MAYNLNRYLWATTDNYWLNYWQGTYMMFTEDLLCQCQNSISIDIFTKGIGIYIFTAYCAPIESVIPAAITINGLADNQSIRRSFITDSRDQELQSNLMLMDTVATIASWMDTMHLKLNPDRSEFITFS